MFNQKSILLIFIDRLGIQLYGGALQQIVAVQIPETILMDLEVVSKDGLYSFIKQLVKEYALSGSQIVFIFSESVYLEKLFTASDLPQIETDILKFFDMVPFESVWSKVYPTKNGKRAVAFNKAVYEGMHQGFLLQGLPTKAAIPAFALGVHEKKHALDIPLSQYIIENLDQLIKFSLLDAQEATASMPDTPIVSSSDSTTKKSNLPILLSVFGILILVLGVVAYLQFR